MATKLARTGSRTVLLALAALALVGVTGGPGHAADDAEVYVVQGLPGRVLDIAVDGKTVATKVKTAAVVGPFDVDGGSRKVTFRDGDDVVLERMFSVMAKSSWDVVVHLPAAGGTDPAVTVFRNDLKAVPKGMAGLTVAHTAAVPPADIRVNDKVLFENVGNGESLNLTVPVATYKVAIVPTGASTPVYLGPVSLTVKGQALNRVYALGDPTKKTMNVAVHVLDTSSRGSSRPNRVNTGTGGQAVGAPPSLMTLTR